MRILHVVPTYLPAVRYGGPIYSVHGLAKALVVRGHDVSVFTTNADGDGVCDVPIGVDVKRDGVSIRYFSCAIGRRLYRSPQMARALAANISRFDTVHLHSVFLYPTLVAARAAYAAGIPYVLSPRGMLVDHLIHKKSRLAKTIWIGLFERKTIARAAAVHVTSAHEAEELEKLGLYLPRIVEIPNGIDLPQVPGEPSSSRRAQERPYVLSLGRLNWKKRIDDLIGAMCHVPEADLVIAGNDEENYTATLRNVVKEFRLEERVRFVGPVHGDDKWRLISEAAVFAMPSQSENFGNSALEAMACGVPVVVTPGVGLAPSILRTGAGIVVESAPEILGPALRDVMRDAASRKHMGEAGREAAQLDFSWDGVAASFETLYREIREPAQA